MHGHGRSRGEHNEYLYFEAPATRSEQQQENQVRLQQQRVQSRRRQAARNYRRPDYGTHYFFLLNENC